jgi:signal transduction histidine kinase
MAYLCSTGAGELRERRTVATDVSVRMVRVAEEQALKLLDLDMALQSRIADLVQDKTADQIRSDRELHDRFQELGAGYPQIADIAIYDEDGQLLANSRTFPSPVASVSGKPRFERLKHLGPATTVSEDDRSLLSGETVFATSTARRDSNGRFKGAVSIALRPAYFENFYHELMTDGTPIAITLMREDGRVLARWSPGVNVDPLKPTYSALTPLLPKLPEAGEMQMHSDIESADKIFAYRRVSRYPVVVLAAYSVSEMYTGWMRHMLYTGTLFCLPCFALVLILKLCLRHLEQEEQTWHRLNTEAEKNRSLEAARKESLRLQSLGNLVGSVAHDFNNLLMALSANVEVGKRSNLPGFQSNLQNMERAIRSGSSLTRRLLGVARKQPLRKEVVSLQSLGEEFGLVRASLPERITLQLQIPEDVWPVEVDPTEFELAIINVAVNARDAVSGYGRFCISAQNVTLDDASHLPVRGDFVMLGLTDNGRGMPAEVSRHAFEPLFTTKPMGEGTGLGLAHVRAFCEQSGGTVTLETLEGAGTTVTMYLPRAARAATVRPVRPSIRRRPYDAGLRILLVEDNDNVAEAEQAVLEVMGHTSVRAPHAAAALEQLEGSGEFDCVVSDIQMPGAMNGIDLARDIRTRYPGLPVVLITGYAEELDRAKQTGIPVLPKPFSIEALGNILSRLCATSEV